MKILIVEDHAEDRRLLKYNIEKNGHQVLEAANGQEAMELLRQHHPDLIISDALMPVMDGFELLRRVKVDDHLYSIPFIFYSATYTEEKEAELAFSLGADAFVVKPLEPKALWTRIMGILDSCKGKTPRRQEPLCSEDEKYLQKYSQMVANKLEKKVRELEEAKTLLDKNEKRYRNFFHSMRDVILVADQERRIIDVNQPALRQLFGYELEDIVGRQTKILYAEEKVFNEAGRQIFDQKNNVTGEIIEVNYRRKDGSIITGELSALKLINEQGEVEGNLGIIRDISERKSLAAQLLQSQKMEAIGTLAGGVAHDFNNILTIIQGYLDLSMLRLQPGNKIYENLMQIDKAAGRAADLVKQLLLFSRKQPMETTVVDLNVAIENLAKMLYRFIGEDISLDSDLDPDLWKIKGDRNTMDQVLMNLVVNSRDAMPEGGVITIRTENMTLDESFCRLNSEARLGDFVCLSVCDSGTGIDQETMKHIFEPFYTTKEVGKGTGLGLSVVYGVVQEQQGWITVSSEMGTGTTFRVYLPAMPQEEVVVQNQEKSDLHGLQGKGERILLVEDDQNICKVVTRILEENGYQVFATGDAEEALAIFDRQQGDFDLLFSDVVMPGKGGLELVDLIHEHNSELPVLLGSGYADEKSQWPVIHTRGLAFVSKPYVFGSLLEAIKKVLQGKKS